MNTVNPCNPLNPLYLFSILRGATHLGMQMLQNPHERRKKPLDIIDLSSKVRCTCRLLIKLNDYNPLIDLNPPPDDTG